MCPSDERCIEQCLNGHPDEFRQLVHRYERPIMTYLQGRMGDAEAASEAAQETFVRAFFRLNALKKGSAFFPWLMGISHRVMLETFRRHRRVKSLSEAPDPIAPATDDGMKNDGELAEAVARLPDIYREVTILRYFGGLSCAEVGQRLGVPLGTVTKRLSRAYALLRIALAPSDAAAQEVRR
jgi:RNA polymerase sigma-70 factor (ECF subfamily)